MGALALLLCACAAAPPAMPPSPAPRIVRAIAVEGIATDPGLDAALRRFEGRTASAALGAEIGEFLRDYLEWLEYRDIGIELAHDTDAHDVLRVAVHALPPADAEAPPQAFFEIAMPGPPVESPVPAPLAPGGARAETLLDESFGFWLDSPARALIDAAERRLYLKREDGVVSYAVAVGTARTPTPAGDYWVEAITHKPTWFPPASIRREHAAKGRPLPAFVPPGRGNPLGSYFVRLQKSIGIHGTNQPRSIGTAASHGCVRMHDRDVRELAGLLRSGDRILVVRARPAARATAGGGGSSSVSALQK